MAGGLPPPPTRAANGDFAWTAWYNSLYTLLSTSGAVAWDLVDKAGSSIADLVDKSHNLLTSKQGGTTGEYYHLTSAQYTALNATAYGVFNSSASQTVSAANTATAITFDTTQVASNTSIGSPTSRIVVSQTGQYLVSLDLQVSKANASTSQCDFWFAVNGTNSTSSASVVTLSGNAVRVSAHHDQIMSLNATDYIEVFFSSSDNQMSVTATGTQSSPTRPASPSALLHVSPFP